MPLTTGRNRDWRYVEYEFYARDNWKIRNDLTLTYGVRWHIYPAPYETQGLQSFRMWISRRCSISVSVNGAQGIANASSEPFLVYTWAVKETMRGRFTRLTYNNFGPRLAFAWNPSVKSGLLGKLFGDRKTVIRGGGTVTYDRPGGAITFLQDQSTYILDTIVNNNFPATNGAVALAELPAFPEHQLGAGSKRCSAGNGAFHTKCSRTAWELEAGSSYQLRSGSKLQDPLLDPVHLWLPA